MPNPLHLYFVPAGRLGQFSYWLAVIVLLAGCMMAWPALAVVAPLSMLALVYVFTCLAAKRLRDIGVPGWLACVPIAAVAAYILLIGFFGLLTIGCCGAGSGGGSVSRFIYRQLVGHDAFFILAFPITWLVAGIVPAPRNADPLVSPYR